MHSTNKSKSLKGTKRNLNKKGVSRTNRDCRGVWKY